jgi:hypothetical protein
MANQRHTVHPLHSLAGRIGGYEKAARVDNREATRPAREAFAQRFVDQVDPERKLSEADRHRRAEAAMKAHMTRLALKSAKARQKSR